MGAGALAVTTGVVVARVAVKIGTLVVRVAVKIGTAVVKVKTAKARMGKARMGKARARARTLAKAICWNELASRLSLSPAPWKNGRVNSAGYEPRKPLNTRRQEQMEAGSSPGSQSSSV